MPFSSLSSISSRFTAKYLHLSHRAAIGFFLVASASVAVASPPHSPLSAALVAPLDVLAAGHHANDPRKPGAVDFAIVIPAVLRLLENDHPTRLHSLAETASPISALQRVVLMSTMKSGFCMDLRLNPMRGGQTHVADWQVRLAALSDAAASARVEAFAGGWRVCARRAGHFELALQHAFSLQPSLSTPAANAPTVGMGETTAIGWPVALSLATP